MKVGVITFHWSTNYGAILQAHGLCQALIRLGHTVQLINYVPPAERLRWWQGWGLSNGWRAPVHALRRLRHNEFRRHQPLGRLCETFEQLRALSAEFDAVIVGSDQVWNGHIVQTSEPYFLDFVDPRRCRRISYAACFGKRGQPQRTLDAAASLLRDFSSLSVRDEMSADLVRELSGREAAVVLDPSLLHDYRDVLKPQPEEASGPAGYIAVYFISPNHVALGRSVVRAVRKHLQLPVLTIGSDATAVGGDRAILSAGPSEWLRSFHDASFICTDSFHGVVFAVKYRKPFIAWSGGAPERISSFLQTCGIPSRQVGSGTSSALDGLLGEAGIDYEAVFERLLPHINRSKSFLENALEP